MNPNPHKRKKTRRSSGTGMKGYSRYGSAGKGLSDVGTRSYASGLSGSTRKDYVTYIYNGLKAIGSFQVIGHTAATLGYGGEGLITAPVTHKWTVGADSGTGAHDIFRDGLIFTGGTVAERKSIINAAIAGTKYNPTGGLIRGNKRKDRSSQYGGMSIGYGGQKKRYPSWVLNMLSKANQPDKDETKSRSVSILPIGATLLLLKMLL